MEHRLEKLEDVAVEASAVGELMVSLLSFHVEYVVGEVVVLVDDEVELESQFMRITMNQVEHTHSRLLSLHIFHKVIGVVRSVFIGK